MVIVITREVEADHIVAEYWRLTAPVVYRPEGNPARYIEADTGFYTDFLTIPDFISWAFSSPEKHSAPAVIHDALYSGKASLSYFYELKPITRAKADWIFLQASIDAGEPLGRSFLFYFGVRLFGWFRWRKYRSGKSG